MRACASPTLATRASRSASLDSGSAFKKGLPTYVPATRPFEHRDRTRSPARGVVQLIGIVLAKELAGGQHHRGAAAPDHRADLGFLEADAGGYEHRTGACSVMLRLVLSIC